VEDDWWCWKIYYLYCQDLEKEGDEGEVKEGGGWYVVVVCQSDSTWSLGNYPKMFESIPKFLDWYSTWYDHGDYRRDMRDYLSDSESDGLDEENNEDWGVNQN